MQNQSQPESSGSKLTALQQQRYDYLFPIYGKAAANIVTNLYGKGRNSWPSFLEKMVAVTEAKAHVKEYYNSLYETFDLFTVYRSGEVIGTVNEARRDMGLIPYTEKIKLQSEHDFHLVFLTEDVYEVVVEDDGEKKVFVGYKPVAKVKPE